MSFSNAILPHSLCTPWQKKTLLKSVSYFLELTLEMTVLNTTKQNCAQSYTYAVPIKYLEFLSSELESSGA